jgi:hypothetical protein
MLALHHIFKPIPEGEDHREVMALQKQLFTSFRSSYLVDGSGCVMEHILRSKRFGMTIASSMEKEGEFEWRHGRKVLFYKDIPLEISLLPIFVNSLLQQGEDLLISHLCFRWNCISEHSKIFDKLRDNRRIAATGYSFLQLEYNTTLLNPSPNMLTKLAFTQKLPQWLVPGTESPTTGLLDLNPDTAHRYLGLHDKFLEYLLALCLILGGQPPRATELLTIRYDNAESMLRGIYLVGGSMALVTTYHKLQSKSYTEKRIPRFLPTRVRNIILAYLYFVRPFVAKVQEQLKLPIADGLLWGLQQSGKSWDTPKLTAFLERKSEAAIGFKLNVSNYRQIAIKIDQDIIRTAPELQQNDDGDLNNEEDNLHDLQAAHSSATAGRHYGINMSNHNEVDPSLWERYKEVSEAWHKLLQVGSDNDATYEVKSLPGNAM